MSNHRILEKWSRRLIGFFQEQDVSSDYLTILDNIGREVTGLRSSDQPEALKILWGPSFSIYPPSFTLDRLLSYALRLRGVTVLPIYCDSVQSRECNFFGGVWGGGDSFPDNCRRCVAQSQRLWGDNPVPALRLSDYLRPDDEAQIERVLTGADWDTLQDFTQDGMPLGSWAKDILVNNYVVADDRLIPDHEELGLSHLRNLLRLKIAYARILDDTRPDRVIANDSYYGMWAILQQLCEQRGIPFYTHWPVTRDRVAFAHAGAAMGLDFRPAWPAFCASPLSSEQRQRVEDWLNGQSGGRGLLINTAVVESHQNEGFDLSSLNTGKPTALLTANVIWDLAALNKQVVFAGMMEWIISTIEWFARHPEYQLILKAHPAEQHPTIPETHERVESVLLQRGVVLPANVFFVSPRAKVSVYDFLPLTRVGIVHTTSVGFEMAAFGLPVITTARAPYRGFGFTYDVETPEDYFSQLSMLLAGDDNENKQRRIDLAYKFISFYHFHYYIRLGLSESRWNNSPLLHVQTANELLPGRNRALDYIVDSILNGLPIVSKDRWPVES